MEKNKGDAVGRIMDAAMINFAENGYEGARMDRIADMAKVNKATIYYHIGGKKALYSAVLHQVFSVQLDRIETQVESAGSPQEQLTAVYRAIRNLMIEKPNVPTILMREIAAGGKHLPEIFIRDLIRVIATLDRILKKGRSEGVFAAAHPIVVHLMCTAAMVFYSKVVPILEEKGLLQDDAIQSYVLTFEDFADQTLKHLLKAILVDNPLEGVFHHEPDSPAH